MGFQRGRIDLGHTDADWEMVVLKDVVSKKGLLTIIKALWLK